MARQFILKKDHVPPQDLVLDYPGQLNDQQHAVATMGDGAALVIAGAGTGKTRTLIYRVAYLIESGVRPEHIVLLTFTRRAAREMLSRASELLDGRCSRVEGGTFHSFCLSILRRHAPRIGFPRHFSILDSSDAADVIDILRTARAYHRMDKRFPKKSTLQSIFSTVWNRGITLEEVLDTQYPQFAGFLEEMRTLARDFEEYKLRHGLMDYDDLLRRTLNLFQNHDAIRKDVAKACRYVLVDEYQDTNRMQASLIGALASVHGNVMAVGDDAQSIYRFRGADARNIFDFPEQFEGTTILKLEHNYRSTQPVLDLANHVLRHAVRKYDKTLFSDRKEGERPALVAAANEQEEASFVAQMMLHMRESGMPLHEMAVLFRSSFNSFELEVELGRRNIPYVKYGGMKLSEAAHVKDVTAYLRVAENPLDAVAWNRILQLIRGVGPKTAADIIDWITAAEDDPFRLPARPGSPRYADDLLILFALLRSIREESITVQGQVEAVLDYYEPLLKDRYYEDHQKRQQDLDHFSGLAAAYGNRSEFLTALAIDPVELTALDADPETDDERGVVLSTIHSAKGLEFDAVFVIRALEGVLPSAYSLKDADELDEELRLLYVALTRARNDLFISYPILQHRRYTGEYYADVSRFIVDVPKHLLEPMELVREDASELKRLHENPRRPSAGAPDELPF